MVQFKIFQKYKNIIHGILEKKDGSVNIFSDLKNRDNIIRALRKLGYRKITINDLIFAEQIHSANVYLCPKDISGYIKFQTDGLISKNVGQVLVIKTADCLPILFYCPKEKKVAAIHAGREGLIKGIIEKTIELFKFPSSLIVGIGPHIRDCCYYLRGKAKKYEKVSKFDKYIKKRNKKIYFNLTQMAIDKLLKSKVKKENIEDSKICTFCGGDRFYSARKMEINSKKSLSCFGSFIGLK